VRGGIFAIVGPTTFSAAQNFVNRLENYTEVIYVGEPTGENVNFYGDPAGITLPHSHLGAAVSQLWWQDKDPRDKRTETSPEIAIEPTFRDYVAGADPALQYALTAPKPETIQEVLEGSLSAGIDAVLARYKAYVSDPMHKFLADPEPRVNSLGYRLMSEKRLTEAIVIFEVNARTHPNSSNAYDSLGEAYVNAHDKQRALDAYRKSVELNPENTNAKQMIRRIETGQ
jgi:tetratricopeptide (TPR) repeat protein